MSLKLLSDKDICELFSISRASVWRMTSDGRLPKPIKLGRTTRWRADDVEQALASAAKGATHA